MPSSRPTNGDIVGVFQFLGDAVVALVIIFWVIEKYSHLSKQIVISATFTFPHLN
jgi:hypothetical protein